MAGLMQGLFMPQPSSPKTQHARAAAENPEMAKAKINRERLRASGSSFKSTVVGSGLKTSTGQ